VGAIAAGKGEVWNALVAVKTAVQGPSTPPALLVFDLKAR
jgi:hypothetical protein